MEECRVAPRAVRVGPEIDRNETPDRHPRSTPKPTSRRPNADQPHGLWRSYAIWLMSRSGARAPHVAGMQANLCPSRVNTRSRMHKLCRIGVGRSQCEAEARLAIRGLKPWSWWHDEAILCDIGFVPVSPPKGLGASAKDKTPCMLRYKSHVQILKMTKASSTRCLTEGPDVQTWPGGKRQEATWPHLTFPTTTPVAVLGPVCRFDPQRGHGALEPQNQHNVCKLCRFSSQSEPRTTAAVRKSHGFWREWAPSSQRNATELMLGAPRRQGLWGSDV